jgi:hypothetical protein
MRGLRGRDSWMRRLQLLILIERELLQFNGDGWLYQFGRLTRTGSDGNPIIWANILKSGQVVFGANPRTFVPPITPALMRAALQREIDYLYAELVRKRNSEWRRKPAYRHYAALTACRILYTLESGRVAPKRTAAAWALRHLPLAHRAIVRRRSRSHREHGSSSWVPFAVCSNISSDAWRHPRLCWPPNQRMKPSACGCRLRGNRCILIPATVGRNLCAIR